MEQQQVVLCSAAHPFCSAVDNWMTTTECSAPRVAPSYGIVVSLSAEEAERESQHKTVTARGTLVPSASSQESQSAQDI